MTQLIEFVFKGNADEVRVRQGGWILTVVDVLIEKDIPQKNAWLIWVVFVKSWKSN